MSDRIKDLTIIGGGPAGLSAAANAAAEGLSVTLIESGDRFGGQAGTSSRIENYLGFPEGVSGADLAARSVDQATRLGAELRTRARAIRLDRRGDGWTVVCESGSLYPSRAVLCAVGVDYRRLGVLGADRAPIYYGATPAEHERFAGESVAVVGGGNSAGQAALSLARFGARVFLIARRALAETMSAYLVDRIARERAIRVRRAAPTAYADGRLVLSAGRPIPCAAVFAYIGAEPRTGFLLGVCARDDHGFVRATDGYATDAAGLYVCGDVRSGSRKRVAAAVGEGATAVAHIWNYLAA